MLPESENSTICKSYRLQFYGLHGQKGTFSAGTIGLKNACLDNLPGFLYEKNDQIPEEFPLSVIVPQEGKVWPDESKLLCKI